MKNSSILYLVLALFVLNSCDLEKDIEVELPPFVKQTMVECYLEDGQPARLLLSETFPYTEIPTTFPFQDSATVVLKYNNQIDTLRSGLFVNPTAEKIFNYASTTPIQRDLTTEYTLEITTVDGSFLTSKTKFLEPVPIDSTVVEFNDESEAAFLTWFTDIPDVENFYRFSLHLTDLNREPEQVFALDDDVFDGDDTLFGTGFEYESGDTLISTLYTIDEAYHDFLESVTAAQSANSNPFAQPSIIFSNIEGENALGVFTTINFDRVISVIQE